MKLSEILNSWNQFWFEETSPSPLCFFRILFGLNVLVTALLLAPDLFNWFGPHAIFSQQTMHNWERFPQFSIFFLLPESDVLVIAMFTLWIVSALCLTLGLYTRLSAFLVYFCLVSFAQRSEPIFCGSECMLIQQSWLLIFSPAGALYSIDHLRRNRSGTSRNNQILVSHWIQRLLQVQLAAVYCETFWTKMECNVWINGTAIYYCSRLQEFNRFPVPFFFDHLWSCQLLSWATLAIEFSLFTLIWIKEFRYCVLALGTIFHLGIDWSMNIPVFEYVMIASYALFLEPDDVNRVVKFFQNRIAGAFRTNAVSDITNPEKKRSETAGG